MNTKTATKQAITASPPITPIDISKKKPIDLNTIIRRILLNIINNR